MERYSDPPMNHKPKMTSEVRRERIALVDGHPSTRNGLSHHIRETGKWDIAWEAGSAEEALALIQNDEPHVMILEILLPGKDGLELIKHIAPLAPDVRILVHSVHSEEFYAERCLRAGAVGYLPKTGSLVQLEKAITAILHGDIYLNPRLARQAIHSAARQNGNKKEATRLHQLTDRELEIMILMAHGDSAHHTAEKLHISPRTVQVHRNNIRLKIGLENAFLLHAYAVRFYGDGAQPMLPPGVDHDRRKKDLSFNKLPPPPPEKRGEESLKTS
jgi:DNA-binding NarL/FixJ family response regulator